MDVKRANVLSLRVGVLVRARKNANMVSFILVDSVYGNW